MYVMNNMGSEDGFQRGRGVFLADGLLRFTTVNKEPTLKYKARLPTVVFLTSPIIICLYIFQTNDISIVNKHSK